MSVSAGAVSVTTTATQLNATAPTDKRAGDSLVVKVPSGGSTVYLGGSGVTTAAGFPLEAGEAYAFDLSSGDALYAIVAAGSQSVNVLRTGV